jgi:hypothetical protein
MQLNFIRHIAQQFTASQFLITNDAVRQHATDANILKKVFWFGLTKIEYPKVHASALLIILGAGDFIIHKNK